MNQVLVEKVKQDLRQLRLKDMAQTLEAAGCVQNRPNMNFQCKLNQYITSKGYELPTIYSIFHLRSIKMHINVILVHHHSIAFPFL